MPDINNSVGHWPTFGVFDFTVQPHHFSGVGAVIHAGVTLGQRRISHVQRPFDGARGAGFPMRCRVDGVLAQIEEMLQSQSRRQQRRLLTPAQLVQIVYRVPELFFRNVIVVDERADIFQQTMNNRLKTFIAAGNI